MISDQNYSLGFSQTNAIFLFDLLEFRVNRTKTYCYAGGLATSSATKAGVRYISLLEIL